MTEKLKTCPFCGGTAKIAKGEIEFWAYCPHCGAKTELYETDQEAALAWNDRTTEDELDKKNGCLIGTCHDLHDIVEDFRAECDQKDLEIKRLREALELIAKEKFYFARGEEEKQIRRVCEIAEEALKGKL